VESKLDTYLEWLIDSEFGLIAFARRQQVEEGSQQV
jgi:hypothetical protein